MLYTSSHVVYTFPITFASIASHSHPFLVYTHLMWCVCLHTPIVVCLCVYTHL